MSSHRSIFVKSVLLIIVAALAFLLASSPHRDSEVWSHLASGRASLQFSSSDVAPWLSAPADSTRHFHLFEIVLYLAYQTLGGTGLMILKAGFAAALGALLFLFCSQRQGYAVAALMTFLALLTLSPLLTLRSESVSFLMLLLLLILLHRQAQTSELTWWPFALLTLIWANLDGWVILGPLAVGCYGIASMVRGQRESARQFGRLFLITFLASLCSLNHIRPWIDFAFWRSSASRLPSIYALPEWFQSTKYAPILAFLVLLLVGLRTLAKRGRDAFSPLLLLSILFLVLSFLNPLFIGFFALAMAPFFSAERDEDFVEGSLSRWGTAFLGLLLVVASWPGWLQGKPWGRREWSLSHDSSLQEAMDWIEKRKKEHPETRALTVSPSVVDYQKWFAPSSTSGSGATLTEAEMHRVRVGLGLESVETLRANDATRWKGILHEKQISHLIVHLNENQPRTPVMARILPAWRFAFLKGRTVIFTRTEPTLNLRARAFSTSTADRAPLVGPGRGPKRLWWRNALQPMLHPPEGRAEGAMLLSHFEAKMPSYARRKEIVWICGLYMNLIGSQTRAGIDPRATGIDVFLRLAHLGGGWRQFSRRDDDGPISSALLAVRAARRALKENPDDAPSYFLLGEAYRRLERSTRERRWATILPSLGQQRIFQQIACYRQAAILRPNNPEIHDRLVSLYLRYGKLDLALEEMNLLIKALRAQKQTKSEQMKVIEGRRDTLDQSIRRLRQAIERDASRRRALDVAKEAAARGLPGLALKRLLKSDISEFGEEGAALELELLFWSGQVDKIRNWLLPELKAKLGALRYARLQTLAGLILGNYSQAIAAQKELIALVERPPAKGRPLRAEIAVVLGRSILDGMLQGRVLMGVAQDLGLNQIDGYIAKLKQGAEARVMLGLTLLEVGQVKQAKEQFQQAIDLWESEASAKARRGIDFFGREIAQECLKLINSSD